MQLKIVTSNMFDISKETYYATNMYVELNHEREGLGRVLNLHVKALG